jgi:hypothetical protein
MAELPRAVMLGSRRHVMGPRPGLWAVLKHHLCARAPRRLIALKAMMLSADVAIR